MNKYQEDYEEFIENLKYIDELVDSLTIEQRKSLSARTWSIQGILGRYINDERVFIKELVDKETPMKPKNVNVENLVENGFIPLLVGECRKCDCEIHEPHNYCWHCGKAIKWSNE